MKFLQNQQQQRLQTSFEEIAIDKNTDLISNAQENISENSNINNRKKISEIKNLLKKYRPDPKGPMVIFSVCANVNSNQFLDLINENFEKFNYHNICTIKSTERDNIRDRKR